jgi:hypothetical protein
MEPENLNVTDEQYKTDSEWYYNTRKADEKGILEAGDIAINLGLSGMWRGYWTTIRILYNYKRGQ